MPTANQNLADHFDDLSQQSHAQLLGMWIFLATELLLFGGAFGVFAVYQVQHTAAFSEAATHLDLKLGTINTVLLLLSGFTMAVAEHWGKCKRDQSSVVALALTAVLALVFLALKAYEWHQEWSKGLAPFAGSAFTFPGDNDALAELFFSFYYALTGLHALHMLIGIGLLLWLCLRVRAGRSGMALTVVGLYWAFVDVVWIFVFTCLYLLGR